MIKKCEVCGKEFTPKWYAVKNQNTCSHECALEYHRRKGRENYRRRKEAKQ